MNNWTAAEIQEKQRLLGLCSSLVVFVLHMLLINYCHLEKATGIKQLLWRFGTYKETPTGARAKEKIFFGKVSLRWAVA